MRYCLESKQVEPGFKFYVKENTQDMDYYLFDDYEEAYNQARVLSLVGFPIAIIREPVCVDGEWYLDQTHTFVKGECKLDDEWNLYKRGLHAKFYTDAGKWLNPPKEKQEVKPNVSNT